MNIRTILGVLFFISCSLHAEEIINLFSSDIEVHEDASLTVTETITVSVEGRQIKHGIVREFPTHFQDKWGNNFDVDFTVTAVTLDRAERVAHIKTPSPYHIKDAINGKRIFIGSPEVMLTPGLYVYSITYHTNRSLGLFNGRDELYWNVNGNGWRFPIQEIKAIVTLPAHVPLADVTSEAYTGPFGAQGKDYQISKSSDNRLLFSSTKGFAPYEGMTIVVTWPEGFINHPSEITLWYYWIRDNLGTFWVWLGVILLAFFYLFFYRRVRREQRFSTIIPLFHAPEGFTPGALRYIDRMKYESPILAADIVNMAVHGLLTITYVKKFFKKEYVLEKVKESPESVWKKEYALLEEWIFADNSTFTVSPSNEFTLRQVHEKLEARYKTAYNSLFYQPMGFIATAFLASWCFAISGLMSGNFFAFMAIGFLIFFFAAFVILTRGYTPEGKKIKEQIEGFRLYLKTAETERLNIIGTPPIKTPELYEHYLPYAMALGCEQQWTAQFAPMFEAMAKQGMVYAPLWFHGGPFITFTHHSFASSFGQSMSYAYTAPISSSGRVPGSSSGSGGRGSSGGGSGGGGGGGW